MSIETEHDVRKSTVTRSGNQRIVRIVAAPVIRRLHGTEMWASYRPSLPRWSVATAVVGAAIAVVPHRRSAAMRALVAVSLSLPSVAVACFVVVARRRRAQMRRHVLDALPWHGDEVVLDVGCGSGMLLNGIAGRLTTGRVIGIDVWAVDTGSGDLELLRRNARREGVADRIEFIEMDARAMTFDHDTFDVVTASWSLHHMPDGHDGFHAAIGEMLRVVKPGGSIVALDVAPMITALAEGLRNSGHTVSVDTLPLGQALLVARPPRSGGSTP